MVSYYDYLQRLEDGAQVNEAAPGFEAPPRQGLVEGRSESPTGEPMGHG